MCVYMYIYIYIYILSTLLVDMFHTHVTRSYCARMYIEEHVRHCRLPPVGLCERQLPAPNLPTKILQTKIR